MKIKIRTLIFVVLAVVVVTSVLYKYSEYKLLSDSVDLYNKTWSQEMRMVEEDLNYYNDASVLAEELITASDPEEFLAAIDKLQAHFSILENRSNDYSATISNNQNDYKKLYNRSWYLFGPNTERVKEVLRKQIEIYELEIGSSKEGLATIYFYQNLYEIFSDNIKLSDFYEKTSVNSVQNSKTYFSDIASLGKYEDASYKFIKEDEIRQYYPDEYKILNDYKNFFASSYSLIKQFNAGQVDSDAYREGYNKLLQDSAELNVDFGGLFASSEEKSKERTSSTVKLVSEQILQLALLNEARPSYPLVPDIEKADFYPVQCQLYNYKANILFPSVAKRGVESETMEDLIKELNSISPKTTEIDGYFDYALVEFENSDEEIRFVCKGKYSDSRYEFIIPKQLN